MTVKTAWHHDSIFTLTQKQSLTQPESFTIQIVLDLLLSGKNGNITFSTLDCNLLFPLCQKGACINASGGRHSLAEAVNNPVHTEQQRSMYGDGGWHKYMPSVWRTQPCPVRHDIGPLPDNNIFDYYFTLPNRTRPWCGTSGRNPTPVQDGRHWADMSIPLVLWLWLLFTIFPVIRHEYPILKLDNFLFPFLQRRKPK